LFHVRNRNLEGEAMNLKKPLWIATAVTAVALGTVSTRAEAGDPVLGALIGGGIGAAIGNSTHHRNGAAVGGVLGAMIGTGIASSSNYYGDPYYGGSGYYGGGSGYYGGGSGYYGAPSYAAPSYGYYAPPPAYYAPPIGATIVYSSGSRHHHRHRPYYRSHRYY
jgi:glycine zipper 2TM protein